jgi:Co/Zn/Cd efflux system component
VHVLRSGALAVILTALARIDRTLGHGHHLARPARRRTGEHGHGATASSDGRLITIALALITGFLVFEVVVAFAGHSLALLADAGHMLTDAGALGASLLAIRLARRPASGVWTFGFKRAEVLSAQANGITLLVISALVALGAMARRVGPAARDRPDPAGSRTGRLCPQRDHHGHHQPARRGLCP